MSKPPIMQQIDSIPDLMAAMAGKAADTASAVVSKLRGKPLRRVILSGCGDSLAAAYSAASAVTQLSGFEASVCPVIDIARFVPPMVLAQQETLYVLISHSGKVSRIVEAARRIRQWGGCCLAITANPSSPLGEAASLILPLFVPPFAPLAPGMRSYCACLLGLYSLACTMGEAAGTESSVPAAITEYKHGLCQLPQTLRRRLDGWRADTAQLAQTLENCAAVEFAGAGPGYGTAMFAQAKLQECTGAITALQNTEDWLHMNYFVRRIDDVPLVLFAQKDSPAASREAEVLTIATEMGRSVVLLSDREQGDGADNLYRLTTPALPWWMAPLAQYLPTAMLAAHLGVLWGAEDFRGAQGRYHACQDFASVAGSEQLMID